MDDYPKRPELENHPDQAMFMMDGDSGFTTELLDLPAPGKAVDRRGTDFQAGESLQDYIERIEEETIRTIKPLPGGTYPSAQPVCI